VAEAQSLCAKASARGGVDESGHGGSNK
jgi:hypothetical protein